MRRFCSLCTSQAPWKPDGRRESTDCAKVKPRGSANSVGSKRRSSPACTGARIRCGYTPRLP